MSFYYRHKGFDSSDNDSKNHGERGYQARNPEYRNEDARRYHTSSEHRRFEENGNGFGSRNKFEKESGMRQRGNEELDFDSRREIEKGFGTRKRGDEQDFGFARRQSEKEFGTRQRWDDKELDFDSRREIEKGFGTRKRGDEQDFGFARRQSEKEFGTRERWDDKEHDFDSRREIEKGFGIGKRGDEQDCGFARRQSEEKFGTRQRWDDKELDFDSRRRSGKDFGARERGEDRSSYRDYRGRDFDGMQGDRERSGRGAYGGRRDRKEEIVGSYYDVSNNDEYHGNSRQFNIPSRVNYEDNYQSRRSMPKYDNDRQYTQDRGYNYNDSGNNGTRNNRRYEQESSRYGSNFDKIDNGFSREFRNDGGFSNEARYNRNGNRDSNVYLNQNRAPPDWVPEIKDTDEMLTETCQFAKDLNIGEDQKLEVKNSDIKVQITTWENSGLNEIILDNIAKCGYTHVRPIQAAVIPQIMRGYDVIGQAETGGGKTAAYGFPIIHKILESNHELRAGEVAPYALILAPTRELARQIFDTLKMYTRGSDIKVQVSYGEMNRRACVQNLSNGCHILVGTCGRIMDYIESGQISLKNLKFFVLDEADKLLEDMQKGSHMTSIIESREFNRHGAESQILLFSATFGKYVDSMAFKLMKTVDGFQEPVRIVLSQGRLNPRVHLHFLKCDNVESKNTKLNELLSEKNEKGKHYRTLVFVELKKRTDFIAMDLSKNGISAQSINGDRPQNVRETTLKLFRDGKINVLIGTDVCSRGLDIADLDRVINYDLPKSSVSATDTFIHRVGRTGRLRRGDAYSFVDTTNPGDVSLIPTFIELSKTLKREDDLPEWLLNDQNGEIKNVPVTSGFGSAALSAFGKSSFGHLVEKKEDENQEKVETNDEDDEAW